MLNRKHFLLSLSLVWLFPGWAVADTFDASPRTRKATTQTAKGVSAFGEDLQISRYDVREFHTGGGAADSTKTSIGPVHTYYGSTPGARDKGALQVAAHDNSLLRRLGRLKSLSLVTLMRTDRTRIFLGVTKDGYPGIHFATQPQHLDDARHLELYRLPYVNYDE